MPQSCDGEIVVSGGLSLSPSIVKVMVAGWWSLSVSFYRSGKGGLSLSASIVKVRVAGWWSLSVSFNR